MKTTSSLSKSVKCGALIGAAGCFVFTAGFAQAAKTKVVYIPGITLAPEILQTDGQPQVYQTPAGKTYWNQTLPIPQGDMMKLDVFVATGGSELADVKVRLDNTLIADIQASPWNTTIDTSKLATGNHMIEVWAQATGSPPESSSKELVFDVQSPGTSPGATTTTGTAPGVTTKVSPIQIVDENGNISNVQPTNENTPPVLPTMLQGEQTDPNATVQIFDKSAKLPATAASQAADVNGVEIDGPTLFSVHAADGSDAKKYAYQLVRDGVTILSSTSPVALPTANLETDILIQKAGPNLPGLLTGTVTMWAWGIDAAGRPGVPSQATLQIP